MQLGQPAWEFIGGHGELGIIEAAEYYLPYGALIVLAGGFVSTLAALNATTFAASRVSFAMGKNHDLPPIFNRLHKKYRTPFISTIFSADFPSPYGFSRALKKCRSGRRSTLLLPVSPSATPLVALAVS